LFGAGGGSPFSDFFENLFGGGFSQGRAAAKAGSGMRENLDQYATMDVSLEDIAHGAEKTFMIDGKRVRVKIPRGIRGGKKLKLAGRGKQSARGGQTGDLYIEITERPHPVWKRSGDDLILEKDADLYTLLLGGQIDLKTPRGTVKVSVPELWQPGKSLRLKGQGFPVFRKDGHYGDLILKLNCRFPQNLTASEKELFERLKEMNLEKHQ
jgi:curved DNA-binding protein